MIRKIPITDAIQPLYPANPAFVFKMVMVARWKDIHGTQQHGLALPKANLLQCLCTQTFNHRDQ